ncbi:MAG TPA: fatty acid desaturase [Gammaproteobacteria bacterium]|nr:fatty acid desaturase [Gammaproteobacteria bacterium]
MRLDGLWDLSFSGYVAVTLALTHVTIASVTIFLHRHQAHRGLTLHPLVSHFFRFWLWLTTGMITREWIAIHRKHHARCETDEDPHSPQIYGIWRVLFGGVGLYQTEAGNQETLEIYGRGAPDDWIERHVYGGRHRHLGVLVMLLIDLLVFGLPGLAVYAVQMVWIPFWAAGVINGVGHYWGYRNFETADTSRNIWPVGVLIGGEEFHNNHHAYGSSAKFSSKWWELDIGWLYICALEMLGLASIKKVAPRASFSRASQQTIDLETLRAVVTNRFYVLKLYGRRVVAPVLHGHAEGEPSFPRRMLARVRKLMIREDSGLREDPHVRQWLENAVERNHTVRTVYSFLQRLKTLCAQTTGKTESDLKRLQAWCAEAEASGIRVLGDFARLLQAYTPQPA